MQFGASSTTDTNNNNNSSSRWKTMSLRTLRDDAPPPREKRPAAAAAENSSSSVSDRFCTMSLSTVEPPHQRRRDLFKTKPKRVNVTADIRGATVPKLYRFLNKPDVSHTNRDIEGSRPRVPKQFRKDLKGRDTNDVSDIEGTRSKSKHFRSKRKTNPLEPAYDLPATEPVSPAQPKFLGDRMMDVSDIEGTKPGRLYKWSTRKTMDVSDIPGTSRISDKMRCKNPPRDIMRVSDIAGRGRTVRARPVNPLDPVHVIHGREIRDDAKYSKPRLLPKRRNGPSLHGTRDIPGAYPGWFPENRRKVRQVRPTNRTEDIVGAQADTCAHGLRSNRRSNPLDPSYVGVDGTELGSVRRPRTPPADSIFHREIGKRVVMHSSSSSRGGGGRGGGGESPKSSAVTASTTTGRMGVSFAQKRARERLEEDRAMVKALGE